MLMIWTIVSTVTTALALIFALLHSFVLDFWNRPRLVLEHAPERSSLSKTFSFPNRREVWQLAIVANRGRRISAEDVEVIVSTVTPLASPSRDYLADEPLIKNYALKWSLIPSRRIRLGAGVQRFIDIAYALELPPDADEPPVRRLIIPVKDLPWVQDEVPLDSSDWETEGHVLLPGTYRLHVAVSSTSTAARHYVLDVDLKRSGDEPDIRDAIRILQISRLRNVRA